MKSSRLDKKRDLLPTYVDEYSLYDVNISGKIVKRVILATCVFSLLVTGLTFWGVKTIILDLPDVDALHEYQPKLATEVFSSDQKKIGEFYKNKRYYVSYNDIPEKLIQAFVASEDQNFFSHSGVDFTGILRALIVDLFNLRLKQGGSTITQQLARAYFLTNHKTITRKVKEILLSYQIEQNLKKTKIIELYLNMVFLGNGSYGVLAASKTYFKKELSELNLGEMALLAGLPQAPSKYNPVNNLSAALRRQHYVLRRMRHNEFISQEEWKKASDTPIVISPRDTYNFKYAPFFIDYVRKELGNLFDEEVILTGGLKVVTSLDFDLQQKANQIVRSKISGLRKRQNKRWIFRKKENVAKLEGALLSINPKTGHIKAMVGGVDYSKSQYNRATQSIRQPGSSIKPLYYSLAIEKGYNPASLFSGEPMTYNNWTPKNFSNVYYDHLTMYYALIKSLNTVSVQIFTKVGMNRFLRFLKKIGVNTPMKKEMGLSLGSSGRTMMELSTAYTMFPNGGYTVKPVAILEVYDRDGNLIYADEDRVKEKKRVLKPQTAYIMTSLMQHVIKRGTGFNARHAGRYIAGKTGTTNEGRDTWFVGFSKDLLTTTWVGHDDFVSLGGATGSRYALPIWSSFMRQALKKYPSKPFLMPSGLVHHMINPINGSPSSSGVFIPFKRGTYAPNAYYYSTNYYQPEKDKKYSAGSSYNAEKKVTTFGRYF